MKITMIAAMANNRAIGKDNQLLWNLPSDLAWFKQLTTDGIVVMGRKTYESIGRPLPNRVNIVLSRQPEPEGLPSQVLWVNSMGHIRAICAELNKKVWIIGGAEIYELFLPIAERLWLICVDAELEGDAFFPELPSDWYCAKVEVPVISKPEAYTYEREHWKRRVGVPNV